jgi:hypothetical protein
MPFVCKCLQIGRLWEVPSTETEAACKAAFMRSAQEDDSGIRSDKVVCLGATSTLV